MSDTLYLVDGMAFAFRAYYAIRTGLSDSKGRPTNAAYGFARVMIKLLREEDPSHVAVVFDYPGKTFRDEAYEAYKATRRETPEDLKSQFPLMHDIVRAMNIPLFCVEGVEADDVMGTLAVQATKEGRDVVLVTGDKDMLQLVSDHVRIYDPNKGDKGMWYGRDEVIERFGAGPEHVVDALALIGDSADNIPGVKGIGDKTAKKLIAAYQSLENLYDHIEDFKGKQKENLINDKDQAFFSRELATIKTDVPLDIGYDDCVRQAPEREALVACFTDLDFHALIDEVLPEDQAAEEAQDYRLVLDAEALQAACAEMRTARCFAVDTETTGTDPMRCTLVGFSMSCREGLAYYIPVAHQPEAMQVFADPDDLTTVQQYAGLDWEQAREIVRPLFEDSAIGKAGHNIKYDLIVLRRAGVELAGIVSDTMVASYLTDPSRLRHNLEEVSLQYLRRKMIPLSSLIGSGSKAITFDHVPVDRASVYACEDADITWRLHQTFAPLLKERKLEALFNEIEVPLIYVLARMEEAGIAIDLPLFASLQQEIEGRLGILETDIHHLAGEPFKINSPKQLQEILFNKIGLKPIRKTKTGYSTDVDVLEQLAPLHALPEKILEYRMLEKLRGTYVEALPKLVHPDTGRIHSSFNQAVAATGRLSSSDPNLQNIPVRTELGRRIREGFIPGSPACSLISADYSQIELRILAHLSGDEAMAEAFANDVDIHRDTAARVFAVEADAVTPEMRRQAKAVNFGVVYGISAFGLARNLGIAQKEAQQFIDAYFAQYPGVQRWLEETLELAKRDEYVTTLLQRRRYLPELRSSDVNVRRAAERAAINTPVQGSAADIIKLAMIAVDTALKGQDARMLLQVHDELVVETPTAKAEDIADTMRQVMEGAIKLDVPLKVDVGIGRNWAEIH